MEKQLKKLIELINEDYLRFMADDQKFKAGDLLKAASWAAPARNKARGNILKGDYSWVRWTGPEYL